MGKVTKGLRENKCIGLGASGFVLFPLALRWGAIAPALILSYIHSNRVATPLPRTVGKKPFATWPTEARVTLGVTERLASSVR